MAVLLPLFSVPVLLDFDSQVSRLCWGLIRMHYCTVHFTERKWLKPLGEQNEKDESIDARKRGELFLIDRYFAFFEAWKEWNLLHRLES